MRLSLPSFAAGALAATMLIALPSNAGVGERKAAADPHPRAYDGSSPSLTMNRVSFIVGSTIDAADAPGPNICPPRPWNMSVPLRMSWTASDAVSGVAGYDVWIVGPQHVPPEKLVNQTQSKHFDYTGTNYSGDCGGGQEVDNDYWVVATDNRGNTSSSGRVKEYVNVWQENGVDAGGSQPSLPFARAGWAGATCTCYNAGRVLYSVSRGARLTYKVTVGNPGQVVGVVVDKNTNRGRLEIKVDGGAATSVPTFASSPKHRVVVWQKALSVGTHTLRLTNAGSPAHPRMAIDSILMTQGPTGVAPPEPSE